MNAEHLRRQITADPFLPFQICMDDGRIYEVKHPGLVAVSPRGDTAAVFHGNGDLMILDLPSMTDIKVDAPTVPAH